VRDFPASPHATAGTLRATATQMAQRPSRQPSGEFRDQTPRRPDRFRPRYRRSKENPLEDPFAFVKRPLRSLNWIAPGSRILEFEPIDVREIRANFHASQAEFARIIGINVETLRNWEQGRRSPHGPARALLRIAETSPEVVRRVLKRHRRSAWEY
jgi:putative transcriptional regulator